MIGSLRALSLLIATGMLAACSQECGGGVGCPAPEAVQASAHPAGAQSAPASKAEAYFALYLKNPSDEGSWRWLCRSAANGYAPAQYALAVRYRDGSPDAAPNPVRAHAWFAQAQRSALSAAAIAREDLAKTMTKKQLEWAGKLRKYLSEADCDDPQR